MQRTKIATKPQRRQAGTSLVEILVVIVVFLTGILAIVQIFPGGFRLLGITRRIAMGNQLARTEIERLKGQSEQLPEQIVPVIYVNIGGGVIRIDVDSTRNVADTGPLAGVVSLDGTGMFLDSGNNILGNWKSLIGANVVRRVIGEGKRVPNPTLVNGLEGSRMTLNFGPVILDANHQSTFLVYGNDMLAQYGKPGTAGVRDSEYFLVSPDLPSGTITLPSGPAVRNYRLALTFVERVGSQNVRRETVGLVVTVAANAPNGYQTFSLGTLLGIPASYVGAEPDSIRAARLFEDVTATGFSPNGVKPTADPYEYQLISPELGVVMFNPAGYNYSMDLRNGRQLPLTARVDYDVYDWRVLREDFRIPDSLPSNYHLPLGSLKVMNTNDVDGQLFTGMGFTVPNGAAGYSPATDFVLMDVQTGGVYLYDYKNPADPTPPAGPLNEFAVDPTKSSYTVDKSIGVVRFNDLNRNPGDGLQLQLLLPGANAPVTVNASGRAVRALYMAKDEWAVQVYKAAEQYYTTYAAPTNDSYYVGTSAGYYGLAAPAGENTALSSHRIYFSEADSGRKVVVETIWFHWSDGSGNHTDALQGQAFSIGRDRVTNDFDPYIDINQAAADYVAATYGTAATNIGLDFASYGYAVRGVKGASVNVRVLWNPNYLNLTADGATNMKNLDRWAQGYRKQSTETFLTKGAQ